MSPAAVQRVARVFWGALAAVLAVTFVVQLYLVWTGQNNAVPPPDDPDLGTRLVRFVSYFTIQSNVLVLATTVLLAQRPDRDGRAFRLLRYAAVLGITITFVVNVTVLRGLVVLDGIRLVTDTVFHYLVPVATVAGWLLLGPRPRMSGRELGLVLLWPVGWLAYTLVRGPVVDWYPYPFTDPREQGYGGVAVGCVVVTALFVVVGALLLLGDRRLPPTPPSGPTSLSRTDGSGRNTLSSPTDRP